MKRHKIVPSMPPISTPYIVDRLLEMGIVEGGGMGPVPLSWREIDAWCARTGVDLAPWEARLLRQLSTEYIAMTRKAESEHCPPPWQAPVTQRDREVEDDILTSILG